MDRAIQNLRFGRGNILKRLAGVGGGGVLAQCKQCYQLFKNEVNRSGIYTKDWSERNLGEIFCSAINYMKTEIYLNFKFFYHTSTEIYT